jgi:hypothetical protein
MLAEYARLKPKLGRSTAATVARRFTTDPIAAASLERQIRRWAAKKNGHCPNGEAQTE